MKKNLILFLFSWISTSCIHDPIAPIVESPDSIQLKWNPSYSNEEMSDALIGLNWALSSIGGKNTHSSTNGFQVSDQIITLYLPQIAFSSIGYTSIFSLHAAIQNSEEYIQNKHIDLGRYVTLLLGSSAHYYRIVDMPLHLRDLISKYQIQYDHGYINNSSISGNHRIIAFSKTKSLNQFFLSSEIDSITQRTLEFETMEILENGQIKFGIFDADSQRIDAANPTISASGKPAKCMWCHESKINPLFNPQKNIAGYLTYKQLNDSLNYFQAKLKESQSLLRSGIDYSKTQDHTQMELLYLMFKNPSALRLASEWGITEVEVEILLANYPKYPNPEFSFLPPGYDRNTIEQHAPFNGLVTSKNVREPSPIEINYID
jgi:hypothetical protein